MRAKWERNLHRPWRRVVPQFELRPARPLPVGLPAGNGTFSNWSGAVATPPAGKGFASVSGTWIVPGAYPPPSAWNGHGYNDGLYNVLHWVGIAGLSAPEPATWCKSAPGRTSMWSAASSP